MGRGGGQLVQLVVVLIVANNVLFLALLGILGSSEVSAIYGGIVGYVLVRRSQAQPSAQRSTGSHFQCPRFARDYLIES